MRTLFVLALLPACTPMPEIMFNEPPGPPTIRLDPPVPTTTDTLVVLVDEFAVDPEGDDIEYRWSWYVDGELHLTGGSSILDAAATAKGQVWEVVGLATDGEFDGAEARASVTIVNAVPVAESVTISPVEADTDDAIEIRVNGTDADADLVTWRVTWSRDGVEQPAYADLLTLPASATGSQEEWSAVVTPFDGTEAGASETVSAYVDNTAPRIEGIAVVPSQPTVDDAIGANVTGRTDPDPGQTVSVEFIWYVDGEEAMTETTTTGTSFFSDGFVKGSTITVIATPFDGYAWGNSLTSSPVTVINTPPVLDGVTLTPTSGYESTTFACLPGSATDADGDRVTYDTTWYVDGVAISATDDTLTGSSFAKGDEIYCVVTPDDGDEYGEGVASDTAVVLNSAPSITGVGLSPTSPTVAANITAAVTGASDPDGDSVSSTYAWTVNGVSVGGSTSTLSNSSFERGDEVQVTVTPSDGTTTGTALSSSVVEVANAVPTLSSASISPSSPYNGDTLTVSVSGWSDADGDTASYTYQWYENGVAMTGQTSSTLSASQTTKGERFSCAVTPNDGLDSGTARTTPSVVILNSTPVASADALTGTTATECDFIELDASGSTDGDADALTYTWTLSSKPSASMSTSSDLDTATSESPLFQVDAEGTFVFGLSAYDGSATGTDTVTVTVYDDALNQTPAAIAGDDDSDYGYGACSYNGSSWVCSQCTGTTFELDGGSSYDNDGDPLHYVWTTTGGYASLSSSTGETTTLRMQNMPAVHGVTTTYTSAVRLRVTDCAGNSAEDFVVLTFECTGT